MAGKCYEERVQCGEDKESNRDIEQDGPQDDEVIKVRANETNNPTQILVENAASHVILLYMDALIKD